MAPEELNGTYTYRSFLDRPEPVDTFERLRFAQLELRLSVEADGAISGALVFPAPAGAEPGFMDMEGKVTDESPLRFTLSGRGRPNTGTAEFHYEYDGNLLRHWETGIGQRATLAGTVLRAEAHGSAPAGQTASFLAVKRDA
jgi:hypothetical protein